MYRVKGADQKEYGPVSADQIQRWIQENRLNRQSMVQKDGDSEWRSLDQFPEFASALAAPAATPITPTYTPAASSVGPTAATPVYTPVADPQRAANAVRWPAMALLLIGIVGILFSIAGVVAKPRMMDAIIEAIQSSGAAVPQDQLDLLMAERNRGLGLQDYFSLGLSIVLYSFVIFGALAMQRLENWGMALAAAIIAMLPCTCCCCIGIPIGIWAVVVLNRADVKSAFR